MREKAPAQLCSDRPSEALHMAGEPKRNLTQSSSRRALGKSSLVGGMNLYYLAFRSEADLVKFPHTP